MIQCQGRLSGVKTHLAVNVFSGELSPGLLKKGGEAEFMSNEPNGTGQNCSKDRQSQARTWAMALHLSQLANFVVPIAGVIAPIVIWQMEKDEYPEIDAHGKIVVNWILSALIYTVVCLPFTLIFIGLYMMIILAVLSTIYPIIGGIKAYNGEIWPYPFSIKFFK